MTAKDFIAALAKHANKERVADTEHFFKTGKGGYSEGDQFLGTTVPKTRLVCKEFQDLSLDEVQKLLDSPIHDHRLAAVIILVDQYKKAKNDAKKRDDIFALEHPSSIFFHHTAAVVTRKEHIERELAAGDASVFFSPPRTSCISFWILHESQNVCETLEIAVFPQCKLR